MEHPPTAAESSFAVFSTVALDGIKSVNGDEVSSSHPASFYAFAVGDSAEAHRNDDGIEFRDLAIKDSGNLVLTEGLVKDGTNSGPGTANKTDVGVTKGALTELHATNLLVVRASPDRDDCAVAPRAIHNDDNAYSRAVYLDEGESGLQTSDSKKSSSKNKNVNRRKRIRPASSQENYRKVNVGDNIETEDGLVDEVISLKFSSISSLIFQALFGHPLWNLLLEFFSSIVV